MLGGGESSLSSALREAKPRMWARHVGAYHAQPEFASGLWHLVGISLLSATRATAPGQARREATMSNPPSSIGRFDVRWLLYERFYEHRAHGQLVK